MRLLKNKSTRTLILIMSVLAILSIIVASVYYKNKNNSVDPRIVEARKLYEKYNGYALQNDFDSVFILMDNIETIYAGIPHYKNSYETGVLYNNRAATWLIQALHNPIAQTDSLVKDSLLILAEDAVKKSISIYTKWLERYGELNEEELRNETRNLFMDGLEMYSEEEKSRFLNTRMDELLNAQFENKRRLSVALTNLGIVARHQGQYEIAANYYTEALALWENNLDAENNLNLLLGKPLRKRTLIEKLFPPERD